MLVWLAARGRRALARQLVAVTQRHTAKLHVVTGVALLNRDRLAHGVRLLLTLPVVFYSSAPFFRNAWRDSNNCQVRILLGCKGLEAIHNAQNGSKQTHEGGSRTC